MAQTVTVSELIDRLMHLVDYEGEGATPVLIEGPDGSLFPLGEITPEDLAVVVSVEDRAPKHDPRDVPATPSSGRVEALFDEMLRAAVTDNPYAGEIGEETLAPAFLSFVRGLVRLGRAYVEVDGVTDGLDGLVHSLLSAAALFETVRQDATVEDFLAVLDDAPTAQEPRS